MAWPPPAWSAGPAWRQPLCFSEGATVDKLVAPTLVRGWAKSFGLGGGGREECRQRRDERSPIAAVLITCPRPLRKLGLELPRPRLGGVLAPWPRPARALTSASSSDRTRASIVARRAGARAGSLSTGRRSIPARARGRPFGRRQRRARRDPRLYGPTRASGALGLFGVEAHELGRHRPRNSGDLLVPTHPSSSFG